jgi:hypothetical protein
MYQKYPLTIYVDQLGLTWDERYEPALICLQITQFARNSQGFIMSCTVPNIRHGKLDACPRDSPNRDSDEVGDNPLHCAHKSHF